MSSLLPSLPTAPVIRHSTELHSDPRCDKAEQVKREIKTLMDLNPAEHLFMQLSGLGYTCQFSPWEAEPSRVAQPFLSYSGSPLSSLVKQSCFSRLSSSKPQHINNICSTPVQAPRDQTHRSYHFFIREQVPHYPTLLGLGD